MSFLKPFLTSLSLLVFIGSYQAPGQQIFLYDQQSSVEGQYREGSADIQAFQPMGQSFTPSLDSVEIVRLYLSDPLVPADAGGFAVSGPWAFFAV